MKIKTKTTIQLSENCTCEILWCHKDMELRKVLREDRKCRAARDKKIKVFGAKEHNRFKLLHGVIIERFVKCVDCGKNTPIFSDGMITRCEECRTKRRHETDHRQYLRQVALGYRHY